MNLTERKIMDYLLQKGPAPWVWFLRDFKENLDGVTHALRILVMEDKVRAEDIRLPDGRPVRVYVHPEGRLVYLGDEEWVKAIGMREEGRIS